MFLIGPLVNAAVVFVAGIIGSFLKKGIPEKMAQSVTQAVGICVLVIGIRGTVKSIEGSDIINSNIEIIAVVCMALGMVIGELLHIDGLMNRLGNWVQSKVSRPRAGDDTAVKATTNVGEGFVTSTMVFCIGAWAITGAIASAMGDHSSLIIKSVVDGITALMLASTLGWGVSLSSLSLLVYQGGLALIAYFLGSFLSVTAVGAMSFVGSIVIMIIAFNLMGITRIRAANCIPGVFLPLLACLILG